MVPATDRRIDLNADLGESFGRWTLGDDAALLPLISSANVACGFHAGDPLTLRRSCEGAVANGVTIGAQVSYPDLMGFGRRFLDIAADDLTAGVLYQIGALDGLARAAGSRVRYVKPHGALYNTAVEDEGQAAAVVAAVVAYDPDLPLLGLPGSALLRIAADQGLRAVPEYFIDRNYTPDGRLVDRRRPDAMVTDADEAAERAVTAASEGRAESMCTHGDTPGAVAMATTVRAALVSAGFLITPFVGAP
ncbi:LamB/YcsF family protein [uncultured Friedmanniella sp.]|uniref:LamB/YcsF family protein n=1 Tax=uncultured Friedmanniella sp. TaxID=335381 RepID=UPI0035CA171B